LRGISLDQLTKGTWIVNACKHILEVKTTTPELSFYEATELAGKAGLLLGRLVSEKQEIIPFKKVKYFARQSGISPAETKVYLEHLQNEGKIDYTINSNGNVKDVEVYCFSGQDALETVGQMYDKFEPSEEEEGSLIGLQSTYELPRYKDELTDILTCNGINEKAALDSIEMQRVLGLVKTSGESKDLIFYNEYAFTGEPEKITKALKGLSNKEKDMVLELQQLVIESQGFLSETIPKSIKPEIIDMMEGIGLLDGVTVVSSLGQATFYTTPQLKGPGVGSFSLSDDVFHKAKVLLSCLRFGQTKSYYGRGQITTQEKMMNIINKLNRGEWVGKCTAIGQDYQLLELDGVIETSDAGNGMFFMRLRQPEVGRLVKQMLNYNKLILDTDVNMTDFFRNQPTKYVIPESRKKQIEAKTTEPVKAMHEKMLQSIRTGV
jgi:hypothetical protein